MPGPEVASTTRVIVPGRPTGCELYRHFGADGEHLGYARKWRQGKSRGMDSWLRSPG